MNLKNFLLNAALLAAAVCTCSASPLFLESFETRARGGLDQNLSGGPNAAANGDTNGNPWFGPVPPNLQVVGAELGVTPPYWNQHGTWRRSFSNGSGFRPGIL